MTDALAQTAPVSEIPTAVISTEVAVSPEVTDTPRVTTPAASPLATMVESTEQTPIVETEVPTTPLTNQPVTPTVPSTATETAFPPATPTSPATQPPNLVEPANPLSPEAMTPTDLSDTAVFIPNAGQLPAQVLFEMRGPNGGVYITDDGLWFALLEAPAISSPTQLDSQPTDERIEGASLHLRLLGLNKPSRVEGIQPGTTRVGLYYGSDATQWHDDIPTYGGVRYVDVYPGVDLEITTVRGHWAWTLVASQSTAARLGTAAPLGELRLDIDGADSVSIDSTDIILQTEIGTFALPLIGAENVSAGPVEPAPSVFDGDVIAPIAPTEEATSLGRGNVLFAPMRSGSADLLFSGVFGGNGFDRLNDGFQLSSGEVLVTGVTASTNLPVTAGTYNGGNYDAFIGKLNASGSAFSTLIYFGGNDYDEGMSLVTGATSVYLVGQTLSNNFPVTAGVLDTTRAGYEITISKFALGNLSLSASTLLGGSQNDYWGNLVLDGSGNLMLVGFSDSSDFATTAGAYDTSYNGNGDLIVARINNSLTSLLNSTFLGGTGVDYPGDIAIDSNGIYVYGETASSDFPTTSGAYDTSLGGTQDLVVTKLNTTLTGLGFSTYLGGSSNEYTRGDLQGGIALDSNGAVLVGSRTESTDFPRTTGPLPQGNLEGTLTRFTSSGALSFSRYFSGSGADLTRDVEVEL